jgi:phosphoglycolate phosphatase-like HAD superfamily hydrolase
VVKAVIFDIDGTLIDTVDLHAASWVQALAHFGIAVEHDAIRTHIGEGSDRLLPAFLPAGTSASRRAAIENYRSDLFRRDYLPKARAFPKVRELFQLIRARGQKAVLASSCKEDEIGDYKRIAGIDDLVDAQATADDAEKSKPAPDIFERALAEIAPITAAQAVVVGDTHYDAEAAVKAGLVPVGVLCGGSTEQQLRAAGCIAIYRDPADLLRQYDASPLSPKGQDRRNAVR